MPAVVGVPEKLPLELKLSPAGSGGTETDHVYGGVPPLAVRLGPYGCPTVAFGRLVVVTAGGGFTVMLRLAIAVALT